MNLNVLLALDDNERSLSLYANLARRCGYEWLLARNLDEFKHHYLARRVSLLVIDVLLEGGDCGPALGFLARCRCALPVVISSGFAPEYMDLAEARLASTRMVLAGRIEKKRNLLSLEEVLNAYKLPSPAELLAGEAMAPAVKAVAPVGPAPAGGWFPDRA